MRRTSLLLTPLVATPLCRMFCAMTVFASAPRRELQAHQSACQCRQKRVASLGVYATADVRDRVTVGDQSRVLQGENATLFIM